MKTLRAIITFFAVFACAACFFAAPARAGDYIIGVGDVLSVRIWGEDSLSTDARVRPDGKISLPAIGDLAVEGLTPMDLQKIVSRRLSAFLYEPTVTVMVHAAANNNVIVHGPGVRPVVLFLEKKTTLLELLAQVSPEYGADLENAYLLRNDAVAAKGFYDLYIKGDRSGNIVLQGGDTIYIPLREKRFVFVTGAVEKPTTVPHYEGLTLLEAINMAGGFTKFADRNDTRVTREGPEGQQTITVRAGDLTEKGDLSQNIRLNGGDLVQVEKGWF